MVPSEVRQPSGAAQWTLGTPHRVPQRRMRRVARHPVRAGRGVPPARPRRQAEVAAAGQLSPRSPPRAPDQVSPRLVPGPSSRAHRTVAVGARATRQVWTLGGPRGRPPPASRSLARRSPRRRAVNRTPTGTTAVSLQRLPRVPAPSRKPGPLTGPGEGGEPGRRRGYRHALHLRDWHAVLTARPSGRGGRSSSDRAPELRTGRPQHRVIGARDLATRVLVSPRFYFVNS